MTQTGLLFPGDYYLFVEAASTGCTSRPAAVDEASSFDFTFDLTTPADVPPPPSPTPESASLTLLGTALLSIFGTARWRRRVGSEC